MKSSSNDGFLLTKASDAERGCFLWSAPEQTAKQKSKSRWFHYHITLMDRDFRRRDAHVAAPYWGHDLVLTTQGKCFPNFKTMPCFKRYVSVQWRCMSDRVSDQCQHDFCSRTFFLFYSVRCVTLPFLFAKPLSKTLNAKVCKIYTNMIDAIVVDVLVLCTKTLLELPAFSEGNPCVTGISSQWTRNAELWFFLCYKPG